MAERWRSVVGFEDKYQVSNLGRVRKIQDGVLVSQHLNPDGYTELALWHEGRNHYFKVHTLVAAAFLGPRPLGKEVNHIDLVRSNNKASNLEYLSHAQNLAHSSANGSKFGARGERHGQAVLTRQDVIRIREARRSGYFSSYAEMSRSLNIPYHLVYRVARGIFWRELQCATIP